MVDVAVRIPIGNSISPVDAADGFDGRYCNNIMSNYAHTQKKIENIRHLECTSLAKRMENPFLFAFLFFKLRNNVIR